MKFYGRKYLFEFSAGGENNGVMFATVATKAAPYGTNIGTAQSWEFFSTTVSPHSHYSGKEYERLSKSELTDLIKLKKMPNMGD